MRKLFLIFSLIGLFGCAEEEQKKLPAGLLPPGKLTSILADIHIAEAQVEMMRLSPDTAKVVFDSLQAAVLKKHGVKTAVFDTTYNYYLNDLNELDKIYERLVDTLSMREVAFASKAGAAQTAKADTTQAKKMPDSLKNEIRKKIRDRKDTLK